jgi:transcriptional regulator with XRE-family HTH domain
MTGEEMRAALTELGWKQADLCRRIDMNKNTVSTWATAGAPAWVGEYLGAMVAIARLYQAYALPKTKPADAPATTAEIAAPLRGRAATLAKRLKAAPDLFAEKKVD